MKNVDRELQRMSELVQAMKMVDNGVKQVTVEDIVNHKKAIRKVVLGK